MSETTTVRIAVSTKNDFDFLKKSVAETMSVDEFLRVLMTVYRTQQEAMKTK